MVSNTGHPGPVNINGWIDGERLSHLYLRGLAFRTRARWFAKVWREILRHQGIILESAFGRPCSQVVLLHTGCVSLPWPCDRLEKVDRWMFACSQTAFKRQSAAIDSFAICLHPTRISALLSDHRWSMNTQGRVAFEPNAARNRKSERVVVSNIAFSFP